MILLNIFIVLFSCMDFGQQCHGNNSTRNKSNIYWISSMHLKGKDSNDHKIISYVNNIHQHALDNLSVLRYRDVIKSDQRKKTRFKRKLNAFISPFDMSKNTKKGRKKLNKSLRENKTETSEPSASLLQASRNTKFFTEIHVKRKAPRENIIKEAISAPVSAKPVDNIGALRLFELEKDLNKTQNIRNIVNGSSVVEKNYIVIDNERDFGHNESDFLSINHPQSVTNKPKIKTKRIQESLKPKTAIRKFNDTDASWPVKHAAILEGDLVLGGLMMVHSREDSVTCGPIMPQGGIQALEAMLYTLDAINSQGLLPGFTLGAHILDDCDKDTYGLEMAVDFIKGSISNIDEAQFSCNRSAVRKVISGVVGAASSVTSIQVANLLRLFKIPQVSFFSTSPELSNKARFEYFTRTIPSDHHQVKAMVEIVSTLGWSYVSIVYEESNYGIKAYEELEALLSRHGICIAVKEKLVKDSGVADERAYDDIVLKLLTKPRARGAIIFGSDQEVAGVMRAVQRCNATGAFSWIGSDGWSARALVSDGNERAVEGTISVQPQAHDVHGFRDYFLALTPPRNTRNPWFVEFWEDHFQCRYPNSTRTPYNMNFSKTCTGTEQLTATNTDFEGQLQFVSDAVMAFAYAIRDMHAEVCGGKPGLCEAMNPTSGADLLRYLRRVHFTGLSGDEFRFDANGDGPARYNILHFRQVQPGVYRWLKVGEYLDGELNLRLSDIQFKWNEPRPPESVCSAECELGQAKQYVEGESCCWHCFNCTQYEIRSPLVETACVECARGTLPDANRTSCVPIPEVFLRPDSGWAMGAMALSSVGILLTSFVCGVFVRHHETPVVRASGRELSFVLLAGIIMCYLITFALVFRPTDLLCSLQRFGTGFCFTVVYASLLTKTNRISRIFNAGKHSAQRPSFISPRSQLLICSGLISIQVLIVVVWMIVNPARAMYHYPTREDNMLVCDSYIDASYMIGFFYPIVLIVVCTIYAVLTRKIPEAFNESKHIGFTMYTTCVIWLAFVPLYFGTASHVPLRITSMSVTISLSASVTLVCLFSPKLYIILIRPERNVRQSLMPAKYSIKKPAPPTKTGAMTAVVAGTATCDHQTRLSISITKSSSSEKNIQTDEVEWNKYLKIINMPNTIVNSVFDKPREEIDLNYCHKETPVRTEYGKSCRVYLTNSDNDKNNLDEMKKNKKVTLKENGLANISIISPEVPL